MLNDFELYNVCVKSALIEKCFILNTKIDYVEYNRKELPSDRVKFISIKGKHQNRYRQLQIEVQPCQKINFDSMIKEPQTDCFDRYKGVQAWIHQVNQFDDSSYVSTTYLGKTDKTRKNVMKATRAIFNYGTLHNSRHFTKWYRVQIFLDSGATKSFLSKQYFLRNKSLHGLPKFSSKAKVIQV